MTLRYSPVWTASRPCSSSWSLLFSSRTEFSRQSPLLISSISATWGEMHTCVCVSLSESFKFSLAAADDRSSLCTSAQRLHLRVQFPGFTLLAAAALLLLLAAPEAEVTVEA